MNLYFQQHSLDESRDAGDPMSPSLKVAAERKKINVLFTCNIFAFYQFRFLESSCALNALSWNIETIGPSSVLGV